MHSLSSFLLPHGSSLAASALSSGWGLGIGLIVFILALLAVVILLIVAQWKLFVKAGKPGWAILVPFYNTAVKLQILGKPLWWIVLLFIPFVNLFLFVVMTRRLAAVFGKGVWFTVGLIFLPFIFYPILAFGRSQYLNTFPPAAPMSDAVKWTLIALFVFVIIEMPVVTAFEQAGLHEQSLKALSDSGYAIDGSHVYYEDSEVIGADPGSFKLAGDYGVDHRGVYYAGTIVPDADPSTFESIDSDYDSLGKDAAHVFAYDAMIPGADPATFTVLEYYYAKDATHVYYSTADGVFIEVENADPKTFVANPIDSASYDAEDSTGQYLYGERIIEKK